MWWSGEARSSHIWVKRLRWKTLKFTNVGKGLWSISKEGTSCEVVVPRMEFAKTSCSEAKESKFESFRTAAGLRGCEGVVAGAEVLETLRPDPEACEAIASFVPDIEFWLGL